MNFDPLVFIESHLDTILTYGLPFLFVAVDTIMKASTGQKDFSSLPADASMAGLSLFAGTAAALVAKQVVPGGAAVASFIGFFLALLVWFGCLKLAEKKRKGRTADEVIKPDLLSFSFGMLVVAFCWNGSRYLLNHFNFSV